MGLNPSPVRVLPCSRWNQFPRIWQKHQRNNRKPEEHPLEVYPKGEDVDWFHAHCLQQVQGLEGQLEFQCYPGGVRKISNCHLKCIFQLQPPLDSFVVHIWSLSQCSNTEQHETRTVRHWVYLPKRRKNRRLIFSGLVLMLVLIRSNVVGCVDVGDKAYSQSLRRHILELNDFHPGKLSHDV